MAYKFNPFTGNLDFVGEGGTANEEVFSFNTRDDFPSSGESGKLYIDLSTGKSYYWNGVDYVIQSEDGSGVIEANRINFEQVNGDLVRDGAGQIFELLPDNRVSQQDLIYQDTYFTGFTVNDISSFLTASTTPDWSVTGQTVTVTGNQGSFNLNIDVSLSEPLENDTLMAMDRWRIRASGTLLVNPGADTFGFGCGLLSKSVYEQYSLLGRIVTSNDAFQGRAVVSQNQNGTFNLNIADSGANVLTITNGHRYTVDASLRDNLFTVIARNETLNEEVRASYNFTLSTASAYFLPNIGSPALWVFGGSFNFDDFTWRSEEVSVPDTIVLGDSKVRGYNAGSFANRWVNVLKAKNHRVIALSGIANTTSELSDVVSACQYFQNPDRTPSRVIIAAGSNDLRFGSTDLQLQTNFTNLVNAVKLYVPEVYVAELLDEGGVDVFDFNDWLNNTYSPYEVIKAPSVLVNDAIHPIAPSHHDVGNDYFAQFPVLVAKRESVLTLIQKTNKLNQTVYYRNTTDFFTYKKITSASQLQRDFDGNYVLEPRTTYQVSGLIHLGDFAIICNESNTIIGLDKSDDGFVYTGTGAAIRCTNQTISTVNLFFSCPNGTAFSFQADTPIYSFQARECIFGTGGLGTIDGGNIVAFNNNIVAAAANGDELYITGVVNDLGIANNYFANASSTVQIALDNASLLSVLILGNVHRINSGNVCITVLGTITSPYLSSLQILNNNISGAGEYITGVDFDNPLWVLENNTGLINTSSGYSPNTIKVLTDDFFIGGNETGEIGQYNWQFANGSMDTTTIAVSGRPGAIRRTSTNTANQVCSFFMGRTTSSPNIAYSDWQSFIWIIRFPTDLTTTIADIGIANDFGTTTPTHGVFFKKLNTETNWQLVTRNNGVATTITTTVPIVQNTWYKLEAIKIPNGVKFKINGVYIASISSNIPDQADLIHFGNTLATTTNAARSLDMDYFSGIVKTNNR